MRIAEQLGDLSGKVDILKEIGIIYDTDCKYPEVLKRYEEVLYLLKKLYLSK